MGMHFKIHRQEADGQRPSTIRSDLKVNKFLLLFVIFQLPTGTDNMDARFNPGGYSSKPKSRRWTIPAFSYTLDTTRVNAQTIVSWNKGVAIDKIRLEPSHQFGITTATSLILPFLYSRSLTGLNSTVLLKCFLVTGDPKFQKKSPQSADRNDGPLYPSKSSSLSRCRECVRDITGCEGYTKLYDKLSKGNSLCQKCGGHFCRKKHLFSLCPSCFQNHS